MHRRPFIDDFSCEGECSGTILCNASTARTAPVFGLQYGSTYNKFLATADEDGFVSIINTAQELPVALDEDSSPTRPVAQWTAHRNAIFDLRWACNDRWIYTASGDTTLGLWDTSYAYKISTFSGHLGSVKTLSVSPHASEILASGSCDGNLFVWDSRVNCRDPTAIPPRQPVPTLSPVLRLREPHARPDTTDTSGLGSFSSRRRGVPQGRIPPGVTAVNFLGGSTGHVIASGGVDGIVKLWDLRYTVLPTTTVTVPGDVMASLSCSIQATNANSRLVQFNSTPAPQLGRRTHAITSLALRPDSSQLLVSHTGGHHLLYDVVRPDVGPVRWYGGHMVSSFYVKAAFSPDGTHIVSGSSDDSVCIWQVDDPEGDNPYRLEGHEREVTAVAWCPTDFSQLATAGDDYTVKVWNIHRKQEEERRDPWVPQSRADVLMAAKPKRVEERLVVVPSRTVTGRVGSPHRQMPLLLLLVLLLLLPQLRLLTWQQRRALVVPEEVRHALVEYAQAKLSSARN